MRLTVVTLRHPYRYFLSHHVEYLERTGAAKVDVHLLDGEGAVTQRRRSLGFMARGGLGLLRILARSRGEVLLTGHPTVGLLMSGLRLLGIRQGLWIHWFTGQVWAGRQDLRARVLRHLDRHLAAQADIVLVDSWPQLKFLRSAGFADCRTLGVVGWGSICGVDGRLLEVNRPIPSRGQLVLGYVGRVSWEKGIMDLVHWFVSYSSDRNVRLLVFGALDDEAIKAEFLAEVERSCGKIEYRGVVSDLPELYRQFDVLVNPSYREGFCGAIAEAQAAGLPVIARDIYGVQSSLLPGVSGGFFTAIAEVGPWLEELALDPARWLEMKRQARRFAATRFARETVVAQIAHEYARAARLWRRGPAAADAEV